MESVQGKLLIANGGLLDPNFRQTVVLVAEHSEEGALGVVLNRIGSIGAAEAAPELSGLIGDDETLFIGGPVQPQAAVVLAKFSDPDSATTIVFDSIGFLSGRVDLDAVTGIERIRLFAGYAGWGAGQLEDELERDDWLLEPALEEDVFTTDPRGLWSSVLRRKGPQHALLSLMPYDPSLN